MPRPEDFEDDDLEDDQDDDLDADDGTDAGQDDSDGEGPASAHRSAARGASARAAPKPPFAPIIDERLYGLRACLAIFQVRPQDVIRVYVSPQRVPEVGDLLKHCARNKLAYHVVEDEELARVTGSTHHEGLCILCRARPAPREADLWAELSASSAPTTLLALENVNNPHNVGAIVRVAAHFGVGWVLCLGNTPHQRSGALVRTAEGGAEHVKMLGASNSEALLRELQAQGVSVMATSHKGSVELGQKALSARVCWLLGSENAGLSPALMSLADATVKIGGAGLVESLNVACATSTLLGESWRQRHSRAAPQSQTANTPDAARPAPPRSHGRAASPQPSPQRSSGGARGGGAPRDQNTAAGGGFPRGAPRGQRDARRDGPPRDGPPDGGQRSGRPPHRHDGARQDGPAPEASRAPPSAPARPAPQNDSRPRNENRGWPRKGGKR